jgi:EmrB/QacA subfamily drug resistance transporter
VNRAWVLLVAVIATSMSAIDGSAVNVALPVIQANLQGTSAQMQWIVESYLLAMAALMIMGGALGDAFGRRKLFVIGTAMFGLGSLGCAIAHDASEVIVARCFQGVGSALSIPASLALLSTAYAENERGMAIGMWSAFASLMGLGGPLLGGLVTQFATWRWIFFINVPLAAAVMVIACLSVRESRRDDEAKLVDVIGMGLATAGLSSLVYGLIALQQYSGAFAGWTWSGAGILLLGAFVWAERLQARPMMSAQLFRQPTFAAANVYTLVLFAAFGAASYFFPFLLIDVQGYTPLAAGAALLPYVIIQIIFGRSVGVLYERIGVKWPLAIGALLSAAGYVTSAIPGIGGSFWTTYLLPGVLLGFAGLFFTGPLTAAVFDCSDPALSGMASALNNAIARTAGLIGIALLGIAFTTMFDRSFDGRIANEPLSHATRTMLRAAHDHLAGGSVPAEITGAERPIVMRAQRESYLSAYRLVVIVSAAMCIVAAGVALLGIRPAIPVALETRRRAHA